ncbi:MAG: prolyl oligopeptidase family serine peptidase [Planctomycetota bacterium]
MSIDLSEDGRYLLMTAFFGSAADKTEIFLLDREKGGSIVPVVKDIHARFTAGFAGNQIVVHTNWEAPNGRVLLADLEKPQQPHWREILKPQSGVIQSVAAVGGKLFLNLLENVRYRIAVYSIAGESQGEIPLPTLGTISGMRGHWSDDEAFFEFTSFLVPSTIFQYQVSTGREQIWTKSKVPFDDRPFELRQEWVTSKDGTRVPMFLLGRKDRSSKSPQPTLLTGYGGFNLSITPRFSALAAVWVENGGVYAVPSLRGGGEFGEAWHQAGMRERKQNVFDDFLSAAEWLIRQKITSAEKLAIAGGSNGGLLVGASLTQRPELFRAVVCSYPLLDMVRYHQFLVARFWVPEYGSSEDEQQFKTLLAYSPYHHVKEGVEYPAVLFVTGDADTRVDPLHARKMAALLQAETGSDRPVLLHYDTKAGHSGGKPTSKAIEDLTLELQFLFWQLEVTPASTGGNHAAQRLHELFQKEWEYTLRERPTFASHLGDKRYNDRWPDVSLTHIDLQAEHVREVLNELEQFDAGQFDAADKLNLLLFRKKFQTSADGERFRGYLLPLDQRGGIQTADELADSLNFTSAKDYED